MTCKTKLKNQQRLREIEDRKIEILMEIAKVNDSYDIQITRLNSEYSQLHEEYYKLKIEAIRKNR
jgi:hypothetical protein